MAKLNRMELAKAILQLVESKPDRQLPQKIANYLVQERRTSELDMIMHDVQNMREEQGVIEATVISAFPLSREVQTSVKKLLHEQFPKAKSITVCNTVDPEIVGGLRIEAAGKQLDTSIRTKLNKLKTAIA